MFKPLCRGIQGWEATGFQAHFELSSQVLDGTFFMERAGGAISVMGRQDKFQGKAAQTFKPRCLRVDHHARGYLTVAGGNGLLFPLDLHQAEAAAGKGLESFKRAEVGDINTGFESRPEYLLTRRALDFPVIYCQFYHRVVSPRGEGP